MSTNIPIIPAVIPKSEAEVVAMTKALSWSQEFHLDLVDGKFVSSICWPYEPLGEAVAVKPHTDRFTLEVDLMVADPIKAARAWEKAGVDMFVFHIETVDLPSFIDYVTHAPRDISVGVSFHGDTPIEAIFPYVPHAEYIQVMGIHTIGSQGQPFSEETFSKIERLKQEFPYTPISVDGAVNESTIGRLAKAGVDRFIVGSAIVKQEDPEAAYKKLCSLIR
jgi:ribulose-phosphate 3-epimerase